MKTLYCELVKLTCLSAHLLWCSTLLLKKMQSITGGIALIAVLHMWKSASNPKYRNMCPALPQAKHGSVLLNAIKTACSYWRSIHTCANKVPCTSLVHAEFGKCVQEKSPADYIIDEADRLQKEGRFKAAYTYLRKHCDMDNPEVLWRFGRACSQMFKFRKNLDSTTAKQLGIVVKEGVNAVIKASELDAKNPHCFYVSIQVVVSNLLYTSCSK